MFELKSDMCYQNSQTFSKIKDPNVFIIGLVLRSYGFEDRKIKRRFFSVLRYSTTKGIRICKRFINFKVKLEQYRRATKRETKVMLATDKKA